MKHHTYKKHPSSLLPFLACLVALPLASCEGPVGAYGDYEGYDPYEGHNNALGSLLYGAYHNAPLRQPRHVGDHNMAVYRAGVDRRAAPGRSIRVPSNHGDSHYSESHLHTKPQKKKYQTLPSHYYGRPH